MLEALGITPVPGDQEVSGADELPPVPRFKDSGVLKPPGNKVLDNQEVKFSLIKNELLYFKKKEVDLTKYRVQCKFFFI